MLIAKALILHMLRELLKGRSLCVEQALRSILVFILKHWRMKAECSCSMHLLGGSWVVISRGISPRIGLITVVTLLSPTYNPVITPHELPSRSAAASTSSSSFWKQNHEP